MKKFAILLLCLLIVLLIGLGGMWFWQKYRASLRNQVQQQAQTKVVETSLDSSRRPSLMPKGIPLEDSGQSVITNTESSIDGGKNITVERSFTTAKSLDENFTIYANWLKSTGWKVQVPSNDKTFKVIVGSKDNLNLKVELSENAQSKVRKVQINVYYAK